MTGQEAYDHLIAELREITTIDSVGSVLGWDEETYMPPKGGELRAAQIAIIARLSHERFTSPRIGEWLDAVAGSPLVADPLGDAAVNVRHTRRLYDRLRKLPVSLVEEMTRTRILAHQAWVDARTRSEFPLFEPWLAKTLDLKRQEARCIGYTGSMYNALLDAYEPGETVENIRGVFQTLRQPLVDLVGRIASSGKKAPVGILQQRYPIPAQAELGRMAAERIGFDFSAGRVDIAAHPFCSTFGPGDCRITTRYNENDFGDAFFSSLHEAGHGLYEQGLQKEHWGTPRGESVSLGIHESQSRMWENLVGRGRPFWRFFLPRVRAAFRSVLRGVTEDQWLFAINSVQSSLIRVDADETTYNLHVLLRFELEQEMLDGAIAPADVPAAWNQRMKAYLGVDVPNDAQGALQDVHWSHGSIGYFATYTLGNLYAAQFYERAQADIPGLEKHFAKGDFAPLLAWLREKIHRHGKRYTARELVKEVTGRDPSADALLRHLKANADAWY